LRSLRPSLVDKRDVAIPVNQFKLTDGKLVLPGATKETLAGMPMTDRFCSHQSISFRASQWTCLTAAISLRHLT
jgi:hypothetical protein